MLLRLLWITSMQIEPRRNRWLNAKEAADYIGVHITTLYRYMRRRRNRPPFSRFTETGPYRFPTDQFVEWADNPTKKG